MFYDSNANIKDPCKTKISKIFEAFIYFYTVVITLIVEFLLNFEGD